MNRSRDQAPDGSPVGLYTILAPLGEAELVHDCVPAGEAILELGCGAGRITHGLLALGHPVVAVDQSDEMLSHVRGAETVLADIEGLHLDRSFRVVLLASNLVNAAEARLGREFLLACRRHVSDDGVVILQRLDPVQTWDETETSIGGVHSRLRDVRVAGSLVSATAEYRASDRAWTHTFTSRILDDAALDEALAEAELVRRRWLDPACTWVEATAVSGPDRTRSLTKDVAARHRRQRN